MEVKYNYAENVYEFEGYKWIKKPYGYEYANLIGKLDSNEIKGKVYSESGSYIGDFIVKKK